MTSQPIHFILLLALAVSTGCKSPEQKRNEDLVSQLEAELAAKKADSGFHAAERPVVIEKPCTRDRPYKSWSNEELNIAQVEYMGKPESMGLIREAGCRTAGK